MVLRGTVYNFSTIDQSIFSLIRSLLGDFDFSELQTADYRMGPFLFIIFVCLAVFVVLNMLIAIISNSYDDVCEELAEEPAPNLFDDLKEYVLELDFVKKINCCSKKKTEQEAEEYTVSVPAGSGVSQQLTLKQRKRNKYVNAVITRIRLK